MFVAETRRSTPFNTSECQRGATLIETLIALFVMAIGLLGTLALEVGSLRVNQAAMQGSEAQLLASDMAERIMAYDDPQLASDDDDYANIDTRNQYTLPQCDASGCNSAQQVQKDAAQWQSTLSTLMPSGIGMISHVNEQYTITVMWDKARTGATGTDCSGDAEVDLACYRITL